MIRAFTLCFVITAAAATAHAKGLSAERASPGRALPTQERIQASPLAETARAMIQAFDQRRGVFQPLPKTDQLTVKFAQDRVAALMDAHRYTHSIVRGLSAAAAPDDALEIAEQLNSLIETHDQAIFAALTELMTAQEFAHDGWFVTSRFGATTERQAGQLLATASSNRAFLIGLLGRLESLSARGEASNESLHAAVKALGSAPQSISYSTGFSG